MSELATTQNNSIPSILGTAASRGCSDVHLKAGQCPVFRHNGNLQAVNALPTVGAMEIKDFIADYAPATALEIWVKDNQTDFSYSLEGVGRFRVNGFLQRGLPSLVFRQVQDTPPTLASLHLDESFFSKISRLKDGIVLVCGATGSGKSSTMAAVVNLINETSARHIITLEDPIEFNHTDKQGLVNQREIGIDAFSFEDGLKAALRQDPDVIVIGEMRDRATFETALKAAETGHLVFSTLHAAHSQQAVRRLFEFFPQGMQESVRRQIADALKAVVVQKLIPLADGSGRYPATEIFYMDAVGKKAVAEGKFENIPAAIEAGAENGSRTFNRELYDLVKKGIISKKDALSFSTNPSQLEMNLKGIFLSSGGLVG